MDDSGLVQIERQRSELEQNIKNLRKSLQHWQTWEIEYEGLREEIASLPNESGTDDILAIARDFRAELVNEKELQTIIGGQGRPIRNQTRIVDLLAKRVEYGIRNARTIEKQLSDAQKKRNALLLAEEPDYRDDAGLPLTEITEELDDDGNIVSSKTETPGSTVPQLVDVLRKAGVKDLFEQDGIVTTSQKQTNGVQQTRYQSPRGEGIAGPYLGPRAVVKEGAATQAPLSETQLDDDISSTRDSTEPEKITNQEHKDTTPENHKQPLGKNFTINGDEPGPGNGYDTVATTHTSDTPEEAALRREMLQYGLGEVGAIVAELDLEETGSEVSYDEDQAALSMDSDFDENDVDDEDDLEDENGMVKHPAMSRKYLEKIKELEDKHGIKGMQNLGPDTSRLPKEVQSDLERPSTAEAARKAALSREAESKDLAAAAPPRTQRDLSKPKKKVAFAEELDIASEIGLQTPQKDMSKIRPERLNLGKPIKDSVVERQSSSVPINVMQSPTAREPSKFKTAREATPQTPSLPLSPTSLQQQHSNDKSNSNPPPHKTSADSVIERDTTTNPNLAHPDELDESIHHKEVAAEYYKLRNRMIQRQGGFVGEGEADNYGEAMTPLPVIDENGKEKKISRFKAARLR